MDGVHVVMPVGGLIKIVLVVALVVFVASMLLGARGAADPDQEVPANQLATSCLAS